MVDLAIVGTGPVGGTLALALAASDLDVVALDSRAPDAAPKGDRSLALSHGARLILERLGVWQSLEAMDGAVTPIVAIDVSQAGGFGTTRLSAAEHRLPALGYVVSYVALQQQIDRALVGAGVGVRYGATVSDVEGDPYQATIRFADGGTPLHARLAVVADGTGAVVAGIRRERRDYGQVAVIAPVWIDREHRGVAYERFTPEGPLALLPERDHYGLVWTMSPVRAQHVLALADEAFVAALGHRFGARVAGFRAVGPRRSFPLTLERAH
jgi:2-octaprenyl-6-methoxyphenol hydroxylase